MQIIWTFLSTENARLAIARWQSLTSERCSPGLGAKRYSGGAVFVCRRQGEGERWRGGTALSASFSVCNAAQQVAKDSWQGLRICLGKQEEKQATKVPPEAPFHSCGGFSRINSGTLPTQRGLWEQCPGRRHGVARSGNTQVCVFLQRLSAFHTSAALLHKGRKTPEVLVAGKREKLGSGSRGALCQICSLT